MNQIAEKIKSEIGAFRDSNFRYTVEDRSCHFAFPLLMPDGWQTSFSLYKDSLSNVYRLSDNGKVFQFLEDHRVNPYKKSKVTELINLKCDFFGITQDKSEIVFIKSGDTPSALEIEMFAEGIQSIAYLIYRSEEAPIQHNYVKRNFEAYLNSKHINYKQNIEVEGKTIKTITMDYGFFFKHPTYCQIADISSDTHNYMERWGFRFDQIRKADNTAKLAMIYNPDMDCWDEYSLNIGKDIANVFVPYSEFSKIETLVS